MNFSKKLKKNLIVLAKVMLWTGCIIALSSTAWCRTDTAQKVTKPVEQSINIRQGTQKDMDKWEKEKSKLVLLYERLEQEHEMLASENNDLKISLAGQKNLNNTLLKQHEESLRIKKELFPFLKELYGRMSILVTNDPPFLTEERTNRLSSIEKVINDPEVTIAEKYRKVMEALFVEAEYGSTIEVYQDKVKIGEEDVLGNIFRLGRVSLFFLSLDQQSCAYFNVEKNLWNPLPEEHLIAIRSAVEIGSKRRPAELLPLPLGKLAAQGGE